MLVNFFSSSLRTAPRALSEPGVLLRMAPRILFESCGRWRLARGMRTTMCAPREANIHGPTELFTRRPVERVPSRERGESRCPDLACKAGLTVDAQTR